MKKTQVQPQSNFIVHESEMHLVCKSHFLCFPFSFLPDAELESLFKKHFISVSFFKGTVLNGDDCQRVKVGSWIVLTNLQNKNAIYERRQQTLSDKRDNNDYV